MKIKVVVVGNCQSRPIAKLLEKMTLEVEVIKIAVVHLLSNEDEEEYTPFFKEADYIVTQLVNNSYSCAFLRTDELLKHYGSKVIKLVNLYYRGESPEWVYIKDEGKNLEGPLLEYHNEFIYDCWKSGKSMDAANADIAHQSTEAVREKIKLDSIKSLEQREEHADVKITPYIKKNSGKKKAFPYF